MVEKTYRTKEEQIEYFRECSKNFEIMADRTDNKLLSEFYRGKAEAYDLAAFELEHNMT